jgi:hypothetical protein
VKDTYTEDEISDIVMQRQTELLRFLVITQQGAEACDSQNQICWKILDMHGWPMKYRVIVVKMEESFFEKYCKGICRREMSLLPIKFR